jgi:hypothetical protein
MILNVSTWLAGLSYRANGLKRARSASYWRAYPSRVWFSGYSTICVLIPLLIPRTDRQWSCRPGVGRWSASLEPLMKETCAWAMAPADARLRGLEICEEKAGTGRPVRRSVWAGDLACELAESHAHTDPESLRDPRLLFLTDWRTGPTCHAEAIDGGGLARPDLTRICMLASVAWRRSVSGFQNPRLCPLVFKKYRSNTPPPAAQCMPDLLPHAHDLWMNFMRMLWIEIPVMPGRQKRVPASFCS